MALLERVSTLIRANLNDLIDQAENPEKLIKQVILDMQNQLMQVKTQAAIAMADQHVHPGGVAIARRDNRDFVHVGQQAARTASLRHAGDEFIDTPLDMFVETRLDVHRFGFSYALLEMISASASPVKRVRPHARQRNQARLSARSVSWHLSVRFRCLQDRGGQCVPLGILHHRDHRLV